MSESPGSVMDKEDTRKYLPQAVPKSTLSAHIHPAGKSVKALQRRENQNSTILNPRTDMSSGHPQSIPLLQETGRENRQPSSSAHPGDDTLRLSFRHLPRPPTPIVLPHAVGHEREGSVPSTEHAEQLGPGPQVPGESSMCLACAPPATCHIPVSPPTLSIPRYQARDRHRLTPDDRERPRFNSGRPARRKCRGSRIVRKGLTSSVVVHVGLRKHSVVLDLRLAQGRAVVADDHELGLARSQRLECGLVAQGVLARLHHKREARVDGLGRCLSFLGHLELIVFSAWSAHGAAQPQGSRQRLLLAHVSHSTIQSACRTKPLRPHHHTRP
jgi:hypothetical protein